jgi:hypothetical protein
MALAPAASPSGGTLVRIVRAGGVLVCCVCYTTRVCGPLPELAASIWQRRLHGTLASLHYTRESTSEQVTGSGMLRPEGV